MGFHILEKAPYSQLYEFRLWKEAWFFHLFWMKRFENVFPFLLCQYDTVRKYWTAEVNEWNEWSKWISSGPLSHNCMSDYHFKKNNKKRKEDPIILWKSDFFFFCQEQCHIVLCMPWNIYIEYFGKCVSFSRSNHGITCHSLLLSQSKRQHMPNDSSV